MFPHRRFACLLVATTGLIAPAFAAAPTDPSLPGATAPGASARGAFTAVDMLSLDRLGDPQVSPDGRYAAFVLTRMDREANRGRSTIHLADLSRSDTATVQLTGSGGNDNNPRWAPDGQSVYFLSTRSGSAQVWRIPLNGGEARQITNTSLPINALKVSPEGSRLLVSIDVFPDCSDLACSKQRFDARETQKARGVVHDQLFIRHWDRWEDGSNAHLFSISVTPGGETGAIVDLMTGMRANVPSRPMGGDEEYTISPDGRQVVFSARLADRNEAWSTNFDLYQVPADGSQPMVNLTADNPAWDTQPVFLTGGRLAWLAMSRLGFESDRYRVMLRDPRNGGSRELAPGWDYSPLRLMASRDRRRLLANAPDNGQVSLFDIDADTGRTRRLLGQGEVKEFSAGARGTVVALANLDTPPDLHFVPARGGAPRRVTAVNAKLLDARFQADAQQFTFKGADDEAVKGYVVKPHGYVAGRKYPVAFIIHGGPQVAMGNDWSYRWNPKVFAGAGYAVIVIDFHGSPGYGQKFTDSISRDWGGKPFVDLQRGLAAALGQFDYLDGDRACALGPSFGGFMINWIAGNWPDRFRCLVNHDGIFDQRTMYYSTEELWFPEWEHGGTYYENAASHEKFNPAAHVEKWRTPMLVIQGALDFRIPEAQGIATFTALQRRGIKSRLLYFPDENHWVLKPANSELWYRTVLGWLDEHLKGG